MSTHESSPAVPAEPQRDGSTPGNVTLSRNVASTSPASAAPSPGGDVPARERLNVPGVVALILVAITTLQAFFAPIIFRAAQTDEQLQFSAALLGGVQSVMLIIAAGIAVGGVLMRSAPRLRWTAVGALTAAGIGLLSLLLGWLGGLIVGSA